MQESASREEGRLKSKPHWPSLVSLALIFIVSISLVFMRLEMLGAKNIELQAKLRRTESDIKSARKELNNVRSDSENLRDETKRIKKEQSENTNSLSFFTKLMGKWECDTFPDLKLATLTLRQGGRATLATLAAPSDDSAASAPASAAPSGGYGVSESNKPIVTGAPGISEENRGPVSGGINPPPDATHEQAGEWFASLDGGAILCQLEEETGATPQGIKFMVYRRSGKTILSLQDDHGVEHVFTKKD